MTLPWKNEGITKLEWVTREVANAVSAGKAWNLETVDFSDPSRPPTCLEVDFPIAPINELAIIEGKGSGALKPIYQTMKWWARRRSVVFRSMLLSAAIKSPDDPLEAAKLVWNVYYGNHQQKGIFRHLRIADIFMGGGTTVVEGSRLGMQMYGNDLNPVAWFVVKSELAQVSREEVQSLLAEIETEVKPQIRPFFACECPRGHKGKWTDVDGRLMSDDFNPLSFGPTKRMDYCYEGPEVIYTFWAKHGPCPVTGCGHRTPIMTSSVVAEKTVTIRAWKCICKKCERTYDLEDRDVRMAPSVPLIVLDSEPSYAIAQLNFKNDPESATCPHCGEKEQFGKLAKPSSKAITLTLVIHPDWLKGESAADELGQPYGGRAEDPAEPTLRWNRARSSTCKLLEFRGSIDSSRGTQLTAGTVPGKSQFACGSCGTASDTREAIAQSAATAPIAMYAVQGYCPACDAAGDPLSGRFYLPADCTERFDAAALEWEKRKDHDLAGYWPTTPVPDGLKVRELHNYQYSHWWKMFNARQLLVLSTLLKSIEARVHTPAGECALAAFQQYLRNENMFCFWNMQRALEPFFSNHNYHPKTTTVENSVFSGLGRGDWRACTRFLFESLEWSTDPWEIVGKKGKLDRALSNLFTTSSIKIRTADPLFGDGAIDHNGHSTAIECSSSTDLSAIGTGTFDAVITDPPFEGNIQYSELSEFFYVWMRLALSKKYPELFAEESPPKALEAVANPSRHAGGDDYYQRLLTACFKEAHRILKPGGLLAFTFHHSADKAWVSVLEALFEAGFYLEATYPIRSDETKGDKAQFGSQKIEYDIIHVCRKRHAEPNSISWAKLRRQVLQDVRDLKDLLEHHQEEGLPEADLQVIRRGKALEYFSRHYGKVYKDQDASMSVLEALLGINQLLDEEAGGIKDPPPANAEPFTRMLLRLFDGKAQLPRDQMHKFLRGTGSGPSDFVDRGWVFEKKKVFHLVPPADIAQQWVGKQRRGMTSDYDQAMYLIGACYEGSGINASDTLNNPNFRPHPALGAILAWFKTHGADSAMRNAATLASQLYRTWAGKNQAKADQLSLFDALGEDDD